MRLVSIDDLAGPKEVVADLIDRATTISQLYDDFVEADEGDGHLRAAGIHASEISQCERRLVYTILGTAKKGTLKKTWRQRFTVGKHIHEMLQRDFYALARKSHGRIHFEAEVPISPKYQEIAKELSIHSSCDGVLTFRDDPMGPATLRVGLEIKTESHDQYEKLTAPKPEHIEQAHVYMRALDLPLLYFMYMNKGNQNNTPSIEPYLITYKPKIWDSIEDRCRRSLATAARFEALTREARTEGRLLTKEEELAAFGSVLPPRKEGFHCTFCPYAHTCLPAFGQQKNGGAARWKQPRSG